jgi:hypothetical protein
MTDKMLLRFFTYGIPEYILLFFVSLFIWINVLIEGFTYSVFLDILLLLMTIPVSIWIFFNKTRGRAHFLATAIRMFLAVIAINIMYLDSVIFGESRIPGVYWFIVLMAITIFSMLVHLKKENQRWHQAFEDLIRLKKIDLEHKKFRVLVVLIHNSVTIERAKKIIPLCVFAYLLKFFLPKTYMQFLLRIGFILLTYAFTGMATRFLTWAINLKKKENELNIEFVTEYADKEKLARMSRRKW